VERFGGSTVLFVVCFFIYSLSHSFKKNQLELSMLNIIILTVIGINYLSFWESEGIITINILGILIVLIITLICGFVSLTRYAMRTMKDKLYEDKYDIKKIILVRFLFAPIVAIPTAASAAYALWQSSYSRMIKIGYFDYISITIFVLIIFFIVSILAIKKIPENFFHYLIDQKDKIENTNIKKYFYVGILITFIMGSVMEINRGFWGLWIASFILLFLIISTIWFLKKHYFGDSHDVDLNIDDVASLNIYRFMIRFGIIYVIMFPISFIILAIFLTH
jgi:hypothetical protein